MEKKQHITEQDLRSYFKEKNVEEKSFFSGRATKKNRELFDEMFMHYTGVRLVDDGTRVEFTWNNGQTFQTDMPEQFTASKFRTLDEYVAHINEFIDHHNKALENANRAREAMREFTEEEHHMYATLQKDADDEIQRLNTIRKQRELNLADLTADSLAIFHTYGKALSRISDLANERMKRNNKENEQER